MAILKKLKLLTLGCVLLLFLSLSLEAGQAMVLIDKSGSMRGFFKTGALGDIYNGVRSAIKSSPLFPEVELYGFDTNGLQTYTGFKAIKPAGDTLIDKALMEAINKKPDLIIIITDNIQDPGGENTTSDVTKFYQLLKRPVVEWVFIFPLKLPFDGWVYSHGQWSGQRAAVMYAVLLQKQDIAVHEEEQREGEFLETVSRIETEARTNRIRCKPLEKGVRMIFKEKKKQKGKVNITTRDVKIKFDTFTPNPSFSLKLILSSKYSNIAISKAKIEGIKSGNLEKVGLFKDINNNALVPSVFPTSINDLRPSTSQEHYRVDIKLKNVKLDQSLGALLKMPFTRYGEISGEIKLLIHVPKQELQLKPEILDRFGTDRRDDPSKIFALNQLVPVLAESEKVEISERKRFTIIMPYPGWPVVVLLFLAALLALLGFLGYKLLHNTGNTFMFKVNGDEQGHLRFLPLQWKSLYGNEFGTMCRARKKRNTIEIVPYSGFQWHEIGETNIRRFEMMENISFSLLKGDGQSIMVELILLDAKKKEEKEDAFYEESQELFED